jgi:hypothetical protein
VQDAEIPFFRSLLNVMRLMTTGPDKGLRRGQVGTILELLAPGVYEIEFRDLEGRASAMIALPEDQLMVLRHEPGAAAAS